MNRPSTLYKYRYFDPDGYHIKILSHNELFFASPKSFNDPFDCRIPLDYSTGTRDEIITYWSEHAQNPESNLPPGFDLARLPEMFDNGYFTSDEIRTKAYELTTSYAARVLGICSLSAQELNILMWSHYCKSHTGFVVAFKRQRLIDFCLDQTNNQHIVTALDEVQYTQSMPHISAYRHDANDRFKSQFLTKAQDWHYESEYRILRKGAPDTTATLPLGSIDHVVVGYHISPANYQTVVDVLRNRGDHIPLFQTILKPFEFELELKLVTY